MPHYLSRDLFSSEAGQRLTLRGETYALAGKIGDGAVGVVRKARRVRDNALFAVKFLAPDPKYIDEDHFDDVAARFRREGERGATLKGAHLIEIEGYCLNSIGEAFGGMGPHNPFIVMRYVEGCTLDSHIKAVNKERDGAKVFLVEQSSLLIAVQVAAGLKHLHDEGLVHRDIKPANVFLTKHRERHGMTLLHVRLGDFGVVKWGDYNASLATGTLTATMQGGLGTLKYMAPEAVRPKDVTPKADIFSYGVTLFELFTGTLHATPIHAMEVMFARLEPGNTVSRLRSLGLAIPEDDVPIAEMILDMHLRGVSRRPTTQKVLGRLEYEYERRFGQPWTALVV
jgi:serine/threonine protein kinase